MALVMLWKAPGIGSQQVLGRVKFDLGLRTKGRTGIGHTGILDPFAEGWLLVGSGEGTKLLAPLTALDKTYEADICLGATSQTLDTESAAEWAPKELRESLFLELEKNPSKLEDYLISKLGVFSQIPPAFSALHIDGKRSYEWARMGEAKELKPRQARLLEARSLSVSRQKDGEEDFILWRVELRVSSGTYIRALARDWGAEIMGYPGYLRRLVRTQIGPYGASLPRESWHRLGLQDLEKLFKIRYLDGDSAEKLQKQGIWTRSPIGQNEILVGENGLLAWLEAPEGKIGRVFLSDPLSVDPPL